MNVVEHVTAWEALDSRGRPTVAARVELSDGAVGRALAPSGASSGSHEAHELRDGGERYDGRGVRGAVRNVDRVLSPAVRGLDPTDVDAALQEVDDSDGFAGVGANAVLAVSLATTLAGAEAAGCSVARYLDPDSGRLLLPMPMVNVVSGGAHADGMIDVQDFLVVPVGADSFAEAIEWAGRVRAAAQRLAATDGQDQAALVADEGGLGLRLPSNRHALELLTDAIDEAGLAVGSQAAIAIDVAASEFHDGDRYRLVSEGRDLTSAQLIEEIGEWCTSYPVVSVEDILAEDDWDGWARATADLGDRVELVGDDLFVTNEVRLSRGIRDGIANSILVKVNQIGLVSRAQRVVELARSAGYRTVVSARSGDTEDSWLADFAVGWRSGQIKVGSTHRSERTAKWNRLLELEATEDTVFAGPWTSDGPTGVTT